MLNKPEYLTSSYWNRVWTRPYSNYIKHHEFFWNKIKEIATGKILDLGCGPAYMWKDTCLDVTGVDFTEVGIKEAKRNNPNNTFIVSDITEIPLKGSFDTIVLCGIVNYFKDFSKLFSEIKRLSHTGTKVVITINNLQDFPERVWDTTTVIVVFSKLGKVKLDYYDVYGFLIVIEI